MIARRTVLTLSLSQLICWGVSYYLIGGFGPLIVADTGWSPAWVQGGFSAALLMMGLTSPLTGRLMDRVGGRPVMAAGSVLIALGCAGIAGSHSLVGYYAAWLGIGVGMRFTLYDAAFAALARIGGPQSGRAMSQITLLGGLSSTLFWPIGGSLAAWLGWRGAIGVYAVIALASLPLHLSLPRGRYIAPTTPGTPAPPPRAVKPADRALACLLYAVIVTLTNILNTAMSAHMIGILGGLGVAATVTVWVAALRGVGQSSARLAEIVFGRRLHPFDLNLLACAGLPLCFLIGCWSGQFGLAAIGFALLYGASNGLVTITRGTLPLVLFDHQTYGSLVGTLIMPGFIVSAAAPLAYVLLIAYWGERAALLVSAVLGALTFAAGLLLKLRFVRPEA